MSEIADEIRRWCDGVGTVKDLRALADRIDREMVELPKDRDGVPIHVGDTVWDVDNGLEFTATSITLYANGVAKVDASCEWCHAHTSPSEFTHTSPDSLERIADELEKWAEDNQAIGQGDTSYHAHIFADRIRKLAEREGE